MRCDQRVTHVLLALLHAISRVFIEPLGQAGRKSKRGSRPCVRPLRVEILGTWLLCKNSSTRVTSWIVGDPQI